MQLGILGSTGSIGRQALMVVDENPDIRVVSLAAASNIALLEQQIRKYRPKIAAVLDHEKARELRLLVEDTDTRIAAGEDGLVEAATVCGMDILLTSVVGVAGLLPTYHAILEGITIALANKETMVTAGGLIMAAAREKKADILPVDSEHSAIFQCLQGERPKTEIRRLLITASGGPFLGYSREQLQSVTAEQALCHPNWAMGPKISIDSATMMNKGLEMIEAHFLFDIAMEDIEVLVHKESIIHSMVEFIDHSVLAQMSYPDMRLPIQYALTYPQRKPLCARPLDFLQIGSLSFQKPDEKTFTCLRLCKEAVKTGGSMPAALNAANEEAVALFLAGRISFLEIGALVEQSMKTHTLVINPTIADILAIDGAVRAGVRDLAGGQ